MSSTLSRPGGLAWGKGGKDDCEAEGEGETILTNLEVL